MMGGMLVSEEDIEEEAVFDADDYDVEGDDELRYYINLTFDRDISDEEICEKVRDYEIENIFLDDEIICPEMMDDVTVDIYGTFVDPDDLEDCD